MTTNRTEDPLPPSAEVLLRAAVHLYHVRHEAGVWAAMVDQALVDVQDLAVAWHGAGSAGPARGVVHDLLTAAMNLSPGRPGPGALLAFDRLVEAYAPMIARPPKWMRERA